MIIEEYVSTVPLLKQESCLERTTSSAAGALLKPGESYTAVDSDGNRAGGKGQVDEGSEDLHFGICVVNAEGLEILFGERL